jgi:hypothetical protein
MQARHEVRLNGQAGGPGPPALGDPRGERAARDWFRGAIGPIALAVLVAGGAVIAHPASGAIHAGLLPATVTVAPGDTFTVYMSIITADSEFNAFDASIRFDPAMLSFEAITPVSDQRGVVMMSACSNTFHRFDIAPDSLKVTLSLLCNQTFVTGPGTIYRVRFRAGSTQGVTTIQLGPFTEFYRAGLFARPLDKQAMVVTIGGSTGVEPGGAAQGRLELAPPAPNPSRGPGSVILDFRLPAPDMVSFDVLDVQGRCIASRAAERFAGGHHRLQWSPPALASGEYFMRLRALASGSATRRWAVLQ